MYIPGGLIGFVLLPTGTTQPCGMLSILWPDWSAVVLVVLCVVHVLCVDTLASLNQTVYNGKMLHCKSLRMQAVVWFQNDIFHSGMDCLLLVFIHGTFCLTHIRQK